MRLYATPLLRHHRNRSVSRARTPGGRRRYWLGAYEKAVGRDLVHGRHAYAKAFGARTAAFLAARLEKDLSPASSRTFWERPDESEAV